jgi:hypothetical protein
LDHGNWITDWITDWITRASQPLLTAYKTIQIGAASNHEDWVKIGSIGKQTGKLPASSTGKLIQL